eukprot:TRINITY_DN7019_c0_g1_i1.p1 TRINITY_DN7019_c0_g1~~TRINITY_DN7019_c0_g1_i1.p1  ORF type:complete len:593 (-),score=139.11 TRINITY_DN7019_c0_g1_i1:507-2285(-)
MVKLFSSPGILNSSFSKVSASRFLAKNQKLSLSSSSDVETPLKATSTPLSRSTPLQIPAFPFSPASTPIKNSSSYTTTTTTTMGFPNTPSSSTSSSSHLMSVDTNTAHNESFQVEEEQKTGLQNGVLHLSFSSTTNSILNDPSGGNITAIREVYQSIISLPNKKTRAELVSILKKSINSLFERITECEAALKKEVNPDTLSMLIVMLENPFFVNCLEQSWEEYSPFILKLSGFFNLLSTSLKETLYLYWAYYCEEERLKKWLSILQKLLTDNLNSYKTVNKQIVDLVVWIAQLYRVNEQKQLIPVKAFYNHVISKNFELKEDHRRFVAMPITKGHGSNQTSHLKFSFCYFPFFFDELAKSKVMRIEAEKQMNMVYENEVGNVLMRAMGHSSGVFEPKPYLVLHVKRDNIVHDTMTQLTEKSNELKKPLKVVFKKEKGVDEGGVKKEFFLILVREIVDPKYGMFVHYEETATYWFNQNSLESVSEFKMIGTIMGLAIYNSVILDLHFPPVVYKKLLTDKYTPTLMDLTDFNPFVGRSLKALLDYEGEVEDVFCLTYQVTYEGFGEVKSHDLIPGGEDIAVTTQNRQDYVNRYL